jgi:hypothetical protein
LFEHFDRLPDRITDGGSFGHFPGQGMDVKVETGIVDAECHLDRVEHVFRDDRALFDQVDLG